MSQTTDEDPRPRIWAEGAQHPPFQPRAFALASVLYARENLSGLLSRCAASAEGFGQTVAGGRWRIPEHRLGRSGRYLPSHAATGSALIFSADVLKRAGLAIRHDTEDAIPLPSIFDAPPAERPVAERPVAAPARPRMAEAAPLAVTVTAPAAVEEDPDLAAIRQMLDSAAAAPPRRPSRQPMTDPQPIARPVVQPAAAAVAPQGWRRDWLADKLALGLGYGLLTMAVPVGAVLALVAHLSGEDLRKLVDEV